MTQARTRFRVVSGTTCPFLLATSGGFEKTSKIRVNMRLACSLHTRGQCSTVGRSNQAVWDRECGPAGRCRTRYADTMNPQIVCTGCNNKLRTLADITTHDDAGEVFICRVCGNQYGRKSTGAALVLLPPKSTDLPSKA